MTGPCTAADQHTPMPLNYVGRQEWAAAMYRQGSRQQRCVACGKYGVWWGVNPPIDPAAYERGCIAVAFGKRSKQP